MAGDGFKVSELEFINGVAKSLDSTADSLEGIHVSAGSGTLPAETAAAVAEVPNAIAEAAKATAGRVRNLAENARSNAASYEAVEAAVAASFQGLI